MISGMGCGFSLSCNKLGGGSAARVTFGLPYFSLGSPPGIATIFREQIPEQHHPLKPGGATVNTMALGIFKRIAEDVDATMARDPAARSRLMVILAYPRSEEHTSELQSLAY